MAEYDNNLRGALFKNKQKREGKQDADYRGNVEIDGVGYWVDAWINTPKGGGEKYMALKLKPKQPKSEEAAPPAVVDDFVPDTEIPF